MQKILVTGFPGFIANHYLTELLENFPIKEVHLLVQESMIKTAEERIEPFEQKFSDVHFLLHPGDLRKTNMGLPEEVQVDTAHHLAALYDLSVSKKLAYEVNVGGTRNFLDWSKTQGHLKQIVYFSTCYVCGRSPLITESFIDHRDDSEEFHNHYEHTKWLAEELFRPVENALIIRPAIVVGDSQTGHTEKQDGPYHVFQLLKALGDLSLLAPNLGDDEIKANLIPVDLLVKLSVREAKRHLEAGCPQKIVNMADPHPPSTKQVYETAIKHLTGKSPYQSEVLGGLVKQALRIPGIHNVTGLKKQTLDYFEWGSTIETNTVLPEEFPETLELLPKFLDDTSPRKFL